LHEGGAVSGQTTDRARRFLALHKKENMKKITLKQHLSFCGVWIGKWGRRNFSIVLPNYAAQLGERPSPSSVREAIEATSSPGDKPLPENFEVIYA